jgi:hypothetical protein
MWESLSYSEWNDIPKNREFSPKAEYIPPKPGTKIDISSSLLPEFLSRLKVSISDMGRKIESLQIKLGIKERSAEEILKPIIEKSILYWIRQIYQRQQKKDLSEKLE